MLLLGLFLYYDYFGYIYLSFRYVCTIYTEMGYVLYIESIITVIGRN